jgi:hypothetical protein
MKLNANHLLKLTATKTNLLLIVTYLKKYGSDYQQFNTDIRFEE